MNIIAAIVVYNKKISDSITCKNISSMKHVDVSTLIIDNSDLDIDNLSCCAQYGFQYLSMHGNKGLSKAYNVAVSYAQNKYDIIVFLDDDTDITEEYFLKLDAAIKQHDNADIFAPIILGQDGVIYSPCIYHFLKNKFIKTKDDYIPQEKFNAIASCLAVRMKVFSDYRFNETLFIDQVDQFFCYEQRQKGRTFVKLDVVIKQNFYQRGKDLSPIAGWNRLKLRIVDIIRETRLMNGYKIKCLGLIKCYALSFQIAKKCNSITVLVKALYLSTITAFSPNI